MTMAPVRGAMSLPNQAQFFDPKKEAQVKRQRELAAALSKQAESIPLGNEMVSGIVVERSPIEGLSKALQMGLAGYQQGQAGKAEDEVSTQRQELYKRAFDQMGDPRLAAQILSQDPQSMDMAFRLYSDALSADRSDERWERDANLKRELAQLRAGGNMIPVGTDENGEVIYEQAPRKLSATEQKEFYDAKEVTDAVKNAVGTLGQVEKLQGQDMYSGLGSTLMAGMNRVPLLEKMIPDNKAANTTTYNNLLKELAYSRLKSTFPGAISNSEREALERLQALSSYSPAEQKKIISEARTVLERQAQIAGDKQQGIVTGEVYTGEPFRPNQPTSSPADALRAQLQGKIAPERIEAYIKAKGL